MDVRVRLVPERASQEFEAAGALRLEVVNDAGGAGLALVRESAADALLSPRIADAPARSLLLRLEVDSPGASSIEIALQSRGRDDWPQAGQLTIALQPGLNRFFVPLHESHRAERVRVRHGTVGGERCVLRQFEIRGVDRP